MMYLFCAGAFHARLHLTVLCMIIAPVISSATTEQQDHEHEQQLLARRPGRVVFNKLQHATNMGYGLPGLGRKKVEKKVQLGRSLRALSSRRYLHSSLRCM